MIKYYKVGGCVRDELMGVKSKDIDYAVEADSYEAMRDDLLLQGVFIWQERPQFYAIRGNHPEWGPVDFILCRKDGDYSNSRHPDSVEPGTIYDDLARRDFTVNAIAQTPEGELIDPHDGRSDMNMMLLRCVGNTEDRFTEDALRILRAVRFHITRNFWLHSNIEDAFKNYEIVGKLNEIPIERTYEELRKCFEFNSWRTLSFFRNYPLLESVVFREVGLELAPIVRLNTDEKQTTATTVL